MAQLAIHYMNSCLSKSLGFYIYNSIADYTTFFFKSDITEISFTDSHYLAITVDIIIANSFTGKAIYIYVTYLMGNNKKGCLFVVKLLFF